MSDASRPDLLAVLITAGSAEEAQTVARGLVERRLAACVNIVPAIRSIYHWDGAIQDDAEVLLIAKTTRARYDALEAAVKELHSYDTPEVVALEAQRVEAAYGKWLADAVTAPRDEP